MKNNNLKNKKNLIVLIAVVILIISIILLICFAFKKGNHMTVDTLKDELKKVGVDFYENHYYSGLQEEQIQNLANFKENGIKIDITNLEVVVDIDAKVKEQLEKNKCDFDKTKITIYPKEPYGQKDYTIELDLSCDK